MLDYNANFYAKIGGANSRERTKIDKEATFGCLKFRTSQMKALSLFAT